MSSEVPQSIIKTGGTIPPDIQIARTSDFIWNESGELIETLKSPVSFHKIQNILDGELSGRLPEELGNMLRFPKLRWYCLNDLHALPYFFMGFSENNRNIWLHNALGTVVIDRKEDSTGKVVLTNVSVAGVLDSQVSRVQKVVAAKYNAGTLKATEMGVSVSKEELPIPEGEFDERIYADATQLLPTTSLNASTVGYTGIITEAMVSDRRSVRHCVILKAFDEVGDGKNIVFGGPRTTEYFNSRGFTAATNQEKGVHGIFYNPYILHNPLFEDVNLDPWIVQVPRSLVPRK